MIKKIFYIYRVRLLIGITLSIVLIALNVFKTPSNITFTVLGSMLGVFLLDLDYILYAYFYEPEKPFSQTLKAFIGHKDFGNALSHIYYNRNEVTEKSLNGVLFQIILGGITIFTASSTSSIFIKALVLSAFSVSIYKMLSYYLEGKGEEWFWGLKQMPQRSGVYLYTAGLLATLIYSIMLM